MSEVKSLLDRSINAGKDAQKMVRKCMRMIEILLDERKKLEVENERLKKELEVINDE